MTYEGFRPTHDVPSAGSPTWVAPDPSLRADNHLPGGSQVQVLEQATGWAHVRASNGWECWTDARTLVARPFVIPPSGLEARDQPDGNQAPVARLDPGLPVEIVGEAGGWTQVRFSNGWECWVDGRQLTPHVAGGGAASARYQPAAAATFTPPWAILAGAALAIVGGFLPWFSNLGFSISAWDLDFVGLITLDESTDDTVKAGLVLLLAAIAAVPLLTKKAFPVGANLALGAIPTVIGLLGVRAYLDTPDPRPDLGIGLIVTIVGGLVMIVGALATRKL